MKAIMISVQPQWVEKILNGEKTIEIRKTMPKCELPCKVYIYCTKAKNRFDTCVIHNKNKDKKDYSFCEIGNGKVVAEFTLDKVDTIDICDPYIFRNEKQEDWMWFKAYACLEPEKIMDYIGYGSDHDGWGDEYAKGYALYIDNLKIYDKPKDVSEFYSAKECPFKDWGDVDNIGCWESCCEIWSRGECRFGNLQLQRPPRNYCYVEEMESE